MSAGLVQRLLAELDRIPLIDPHSHINPLAPASTSLADILGYHYYTELAHSAGMPRAAIEEPGLSPREKVARLVPRLHDLENTVQYSWLIEMCRRFFGFEDDALTPLNWEVLYDRAARILNQPDWETQVLQKSGLVSVFLTNDFDDPLAGFDTQRYIPCLRTDDLVFHLAAPDTRLRLAAATDVEVGGAATFRQALTRLFDYFTRHSARACAISLPPDFEPLPVDHAAVEPLLAALAANRPLAADESKTVARFAFWTLTELCADYKLPFDLMIGVNRKVYEAGVYQGQDLFDQRCSLIQYRRLFNAFPMVTFPISVLSHAANQELVSYSWIFPNVVANGHWWYSNVPAYIEPDCRARLQAVPHSKQIGYYSDMYKLEFALPKFNMYRRVLAKILAEEFVLARDWHEERAIRLGEAVLRKNVDRIFFRED